MAPSDCVRRTTVHAHSPDSFVNIEQWLSYACRTEEGGCHNAPSLRRCCPEGLGRFRSSDSSAPSRGEGETCPVLTRRHRRQSCRYARPPRRHQALPQDTAGDTAVRRPQPPDCSDPEEGPLRTRSSCIRFPRPARWFRRDFGGQALASPDPASIVCSNQILRHYGSSTSLPVEWRDSRWPWAVAASASG